MKKGFRTGETFRLAAIDVRIVGGRHGNGDQVLEIRTPRGDWAKMPMSLAALQADFYDQNEPRRYRWNGEQQGRTMFPTLLASAVTNGWRTAVELHISPYKKEKA